MNQTISLDEAFKRAIEHHSNGRLNDAEILYRKILEAFPNHPDANHNLGVIAISVGKPELALPFLQKALANSKQPQYCRSMLLALIKSNQLELAKSFVENLEVTGNSDQLVSELKSQLFDAIQKRRLANQTDVAPDTVSKQDEALKIASDIRPNELTANSITPLKTICDAALKNFQSRNLSEAERLASILTKEYPKQPLGWKLLGTIAGQTGRTADAIRLLLNALKLTPNEPDLHNNIAVAYQDNFEYKKSEFHCKRAIALNPNFAQAYYNLGNALKEQGKLEESVKAYSRAIAIRTNFAEAYVNRGLCKSRMRDLKGAVEDFDKAIQIRPNYDEAFYNKGLTQLAHQCFSEGWKGYEYRFKLPILKISYLPNIPIWNGEPPSKKLLVHGEQGMGDQILFSSIFPELLNTVKKVCLQCSPRLVSLFQRSFPSVQVISKTTELPLDIDNQISIGSLPKFYRNNVHEFNRVHIPYLKSDEIKKTQYRTILKSSRRFVVGVNWRSFRKQYSELGSIKLADLASIFKTPDCTFVNLQYGDVQSEIEEAKQLGIQFNNTLQINLTDDIDSLASLVDACDLIVSVNNTTAHIAGGLGKPVFMMLPNVVGKQWYESELCGEHSLWYPTIRMFHQAKPGDWFGVIDQVHTSILTWINEQNASIH